MRVLIAKAYSTPLAWGEAMVQSFKDHVLRGQPDATIEVCSLQDNDPGPFSKYDLVILTGGTLDLLKTPHPAWAATVLDLIRDVHGQNGRTKLLAICWGHQAVNAALGGTLRTVPEGPRVGVQDVRLTPQGNELFGTTEPSISLHKFHKREVDSAAPGFVALAEDNEIFLSESNQILTFQSHPELTYVISKGLVDNDDGTYTSGAAPNPSVVLKSIESPHDGEKVWERVMLWASTGSGTD